MGTFVRSSVKMFNFFTEPDERDHLSEGASETNYTAFETADTSLGLNRKAAVNIVQNEEIRIQEKVLEDQMIDSDYNLQSRHGALFRLKLIEHLKPTYYYYGGG